MIFANDETKQAYVALTQEKHARMAKAREMAKEAAWRDLEPEDQSRFFEWAYTAIKEVEKERTN